jgi:hypothetical protein
VLAVDPYPPLRGRRAEPKHRVGDDYRIGMQDHRKEC